MFNVILLVSGVTIVPLVGNIANELVIVPVSGTDMLGIVMS